MEHWIMQYFLHLQLKIQTGSLMKTGNNSGKSWDHHLRKLLQQYSCSIQMQFSVKFQKRIYFWNKIYSFIPSMYIINKDHCFMTASLNQVLHIAVSLSKRICWHSCSKFWPWTEVSYHKIPTQYTIKTYLLKNQLVLASLHHQGSNNYKWRDFQPAETCCIFNTHVFNSVISWFWCVFVRAS